LFPGSVPRELRDFNNLEISMISIHSSIPKNFTLRGGENYIVNGALIYTVVNDVTTVAMKLPRMPTVETIAIMLYEGGQKSREYFVTQALTWLVMNNHLCSSIKLEFPLDEDWDIVEAVSDSPFIPLTENDLKTIDKMMINTETK
jgi:hypothetical protein